MERAISPRYWVTGIILSILIPSCSEKGVVMQPNEWQSIIVSDVLTFFVPPDSEVEEVQPIDSIVGIINGAGYKIIYDYGRFPEDIDIYREHAGYTSEQIEVDGFRAQLIFFTDREDSPELPFVHILQIPHQGPNTFTLRVSCVDETVCKIADPVIESVSFQ